MGAVNSAEDTRAYREGYPEKKDDPTITTNLLFYQNKIKSKPRGDYIDNIHKNWFGNYELLEMHHGFIQYLFPIRERGMNWESDELQLHEAQAIKQDPQCMERVKISYKLMLDFYGMKLKDEETGEIERSENYKSRFRHLNKSHHNYLRITRILKCLGELGYEHYKWPFLKYVLKEIYEEGNLENCKNSCLRFWSQVLRNEEDQDEMRRIVNRYERMLLTKQGEYMEAAEMYVQEKISDSKRKIKKLTNHDNNTHNNTNNDNNKREEAELNQSGKKKKKRDGKPLEEDVVKKKKDAKIGDTEEDPEKININDSITKNTDIMETEQNAEIAVQKEDVV